MLKYYKKIEKNNIIILNINKMTNSDWTITTFRIIYYMDNEEEPFLINPPNYQRCLEFNNLVDFNNENIRDLIPDIIIYSNEYTIYSYELMLEIRFKWHIEPNYEKNLEISKILNNYFMNSNKNKNLTFQNKKLYVHSQCYTDSYGKEI
jgi:hypothetical protein